MTNRHEAGRGRRGFIRGVGAVLLTAQLLPLVARADLPRTLVIRSGPGFFPHTHDLWIPYAVLKAPPPKGVTLTSTRAMGHTHEVALSHELLAVVNQGGTVSVRGGSHTFVIAIARAVRDPATPSQTQRSGA